MLGHFYIGIFVIPIKEDMFIQSVRVSLTHFFWVLYFENGCEFFKGVEPFYCIFDQDPPI